MAIFYSGLNVTVMQYVSSGGDSYEVDTIPFETFGTGTLRVSIALRLKSDNGASPLYAYISPAGLDDSDHSRPFTDTDAGNVAQLALFHGTAFGDPPDYISYQYPMDAAFPLPLTTGYVEFTGTGAPMSIYFWAPVLPSEDGYHFFDAQIVVEGEPSPPVVPPRPVAVLLPGSVSTNKARAVDLGVGLVRPFLRTEHQDFLTDSGATLVMACVGQVLGTPVGTLPWEPRFGSNLHRLRHRTQDPTFFDLARIYSEEAIRYWEPRAMIVDVKFEPSTVPVGQRNSVGLVITAKVGSALFPVVVRI